MYLILKNYAQFTIKHFKKPTYTWVKVKKKNIPNPELLIFTSQICSMHIINNEPVHEISNNVAF